MVNLLWAVHLTVYARVPELLPLTLGIGLGLHWVVFGWVIGHRIGLLHAGIRTVFVAGAWWAIPGNRVSAVAAAIVAVYAYSIRVLLARPRHSDGDRIALSGPTRVPTDQSPDESVSSG